MAMEVSHTRSTRDTWQPIRGEQRRALVGHLVAGEVVQAEAGVHQLVHGQETRQQHVEVEEVGAEADQVRHHLPVYSSFKRRLNEGWRRFHNHGQGVLLVESANSYLLSPWLI